MGNLVQVPGCYFNGGAADVITIGHTLGHIHDTPKHNARFVVVVVTAGGGVVATIPKSYVAPWGGTPVF
jgi:hypothetical protein